MLKQRFGFPSIIVMLIVTSAVAIKMVQLQGHGFEGHMGYPFAWRWWSERPVNGAHYGYHWVGFALDIAIWFAVVIALGMLIERIMQRIAANKKG